MNRKDVFKAIISTMQREIPFPVIERELQLPVDSGQMITVAGVRRCGKSSMLKIVANKLVASGVEVSRILWINFDDERLEDMSAGELDEVLQAYREMFPDNDLKDVYIFLDEIQNIRNWELFVMRVYKSYCQNIFITGSNSKMLSSEIATQLRGWPIEFEAFPLSFAEYLKFKGYDLKPYDEQDKAILVRTCRDYLHFSSFPEIVLMEEESLKVRKVQGYFNTMLFRDIMERYDILKPDVARYFFKRLMLNLTKPTSVNSIYNDFKSQGRKLDKNNLYELSEIGCDTFMFYKVPRWTKSLIQENSRFPKYYFVDNGMRNSLILPQSEDDGKLLENAVYLQLRRNLDPSYKITYFSEGAECDFVVQQEDEIRMLIQVCWSLSDPDTLQREIRGLQTASAITGCRNCLIITFDEERTLTLEPQPESTTSPLTLHILPAWRWLLSNPYK